MNIVSRSAMPALMTLLAILAIGCQKAGAVQVDGTESYDVKREFYRAVQRGVLPENETFFTWWSVSAEQWAFEPTGADRQWTMTVPREGSAEVWEFTAPRFGSPATVPQNSNALISAIDLFCDGRTDPSPACQDYVRSLDALTGQPGQ